MAGPTFEEWIFHLGLQQIHDPYFDKPVYRKPSFGELELSAEIEKKISTSLRNARDRRKIPRSKLAPMLGLSDQVYNRYENAVSRLTVSRLLHICEVLQISPVEILYPVAPHLWGEAESEAEVRKSIIDKLELFDGPTLTAILGFLQHLQIKPMENGHDQGAAQAAP
ncbi:helix-turn-helix domain-containing protein [Rhizobium aegyptiacum]|uniref:helix-turn-helix domain-containing protein n=1 Tax=Rhizobium aegyptiacum TaxID=1764550 RepID=UPI0007E5B2A4|nr:helix-turn-helix transcriptional regulator [Rhizobium aegyptiacum]